MIIELLDGTIIDLEKHGLKRLYHRIPSAEIEHSTSSVDGIGDIITNSMLSNRIISVDFLFKVQDIRDYYLLRDELNGIFARTDSFYIIFKRERYKRWKVRLSKGFLLPPNPRMGTFTVEFTTINKYAESVGTSLELSNYDFDSDLWGFGSNIDVDQDYIYTFKSNEFYVQNIGNVIVDPRQHDLEILIKAKVDKKITITNKSNGDIYEYFDSLTNMDTLSLNGIRSLKNDVSVFKNTNGNLITINPGLNHFVVSGGEVLDMQFKFRFLYK